MIDADIPIVASVQIYDVFYGKPTNHFVAA